MLRDGITVEYAAHVLWMLTSFESFDTLYTDRGLSVDETIAMIIKTAEDAVCRPEQ